jgi:hypothetical protein
MFGQEKAKFPQFQMDEKFMGYQYFEKLSL